MPEPSNNSTPVFPTVSEDFKITAKIGAGGMGAVYEAIQLKLDRKVAVKVLADRLASDPEFLERFKREARAAAVVNHPNLVQVFDYGEADGLHYSIMEYVEGENLVQRLKRTGPLPVSEALEIVSKVAEALRAAWAKKIIHRDIKPENIMITADGQVKLADLGLAKILTEESSMTMTGMGLGSPHYMAPEQAEDAKDVDNRTDIYSLGVTLLTLVTGKKAFKGNSPYALIKAHAEKPIPTGAELGTELPDGIDALIGRMAAKRPEERYADYDGLLTDITSLRTDTNATITIPPRLRESPTNPSFSNAATAYTEPTEISYAETVPSGDLSLTHTGGNRNIALYAVVGVTLAIVAFLIFDFFTHSSTQSGGAQPGPTQAEPPPTSQLSQGPAQPGHLAGVAASTRGPESDGEVDNFLFGGSPGGSSQSPGPNQSLMGGPRPPPDFMTGFIRPNGQTAHYPLPLSHIGRPDDYPLAGTDFAALKIAAAGYATENPNDFRNILNNYEQVWHQTPDINSQAEIRLLMAEHLKKMDAAVDAAVAKIGAKMKAAVDQGDVELAKRVWREYPDSLRTFKHEAVIWRTFTNHLPAAELQRLLSTQPIRYGHPTGAPGSR